MWKEKIIQIENVSLNITVDKYILFINTLQKYSL
jgi:hypothetical protein